MTNKVQPKILIIDDDAGIRETLTDIFQERGYHVESAGTAREAIQKAKETGFNIALIDIKLPDLDGIQLLKGLKKDYSEMACIVITGHGSFQNAVNAIKDGVNGYFIKPLIMEDVIIRLEEIFEKQRLHHELKAALKEKETLLQEIHHRVKNNMQIILSLIRLQSRNIKDPEAKDAFKDCQNRIMSIALIHDRFYHSKDLSRIDFAEYIPPLIIHLFHSLGVSESSVKLDINVKDVLLDIYNAIPCGLIINELVSNSLKHAFPKGAKGKIQVDMHPQEKGEYTLTIRDNGKGMPKEIDWENPESLGMQMVHDLIKQINGSVEYYRKGGTTFKITFKTKQTPQENSK